MATKLLDQIQAQIYRGIDSAAAEQPPVFGDELLRLPANLRIAFAKYFGDAPMGSCSPPIENSAFGKECNAAAHARDEGSSRMPFAQPRQQRGILCDPVHDVPA